MRELPEPIQAAVIRGIGTYLRTADQNELPPSLKKLRGFRPQALARHKTELLRELDREPMPALILQWLDEAKPPLAKRDAAILRAVAEGTADWTADPASGTKERPSLGDGTAAEDAPGNDALAKKLEREQARALKARAGEQEAKETLRRVTENARLKQSRQSEENIKLREELSAAQKGSAAERAIGAKATETLERERRRHRRDLEKERQAREEALRALKLARRELRAKEAELSGLRRRLASGGRSTGGGDRAGGAPKQRTRTQLKAPPGLLAEDPKSLDHWLNADGVQLLVDGYNVSKSVAGYSHLSLEDQRKRVVQAVNKLARKKDLTPMVVFDGAEAPPGTSRRGRGPAVVEYSSGEIADDHLIARLERLPPEPVVFVTNDRELQERARALGATIATSDQLLALAR
jgi:hypothetical protein